MMSVGMWVGALMLVQGVLGLAPGPAASLAAVAPSKPWTAWASVDVHWGHPSAQAGDWIGAFLSTWEATYIAWKPINGTRGSLSFDLLNGRHPYIFRLYRGDDVLAESNMVVPMGATPNQGHLSLVPGHHDRMMLSWTSDGSGGTGMVRFGPAPDALTSTAYATVDSYNADDLTTCSGIGNVARRTVPFKNLSSHDIRCHWGTPKCWEDATAAELFLDPGLLHTVVMQSLTSGSRVYYQFGSGLHFSPVYSFATARAPGDMSPLSFLLTSDMGIGFPGVEETGGATHNDPPINGADEVVAAILADPATSDDELLLLNGDISYARGWPWIWERYFDLIQPLVTRLPLMVGVGNHEVDTLEVQFHPVASGDSGGECGIPTQKRFPHLPSLKKMWYSFTHGSVHIVVLSTEHSINEQVAWFEADMAQVDRTVTPWVIVTMHRQLFWSMQVNNVQKILRAAWHPVFVNHNVDLVYTGHAHYYERMCAVELSADTTSTSCSDERDRPVYVIDGTAGAEYDPRSSNTLSKLTEYREFLKWGYSRIHVTPDSLTFNHHHNDFSVVDSVTLPRHSSSLK